MTNINVTLDSNMLELAPEKPREFLRRALDRGLTVKEHPAAGVVQALGWTIESPDNPIDDWQLWLYFTPGSRGGSLKIHRYIPATSGKAAPAKLTMAMARVTIDGMADALDRHRAREAARDAHAADLNATAQRFPARPRTAAHVDTNQNPGGKAAVAVQTLKGNGKFALRMARNGAIPPATTGTVRRALVNRGLVSQAGGMLTDLGRMARDLIMGVA